MKNTKHARIDIYRTMDAWERRMGRLVMWKKRRQRLKRHPKIVLIY